MDHDNLLFRTAVALAAGLLIGLEREWQDREARGDQAVAGIRTFALIALLGAGWGVLIETFDIVLLGFAFLGFAAVVAAAQVLRAKHSEDYGMTTSVAALLTFVLGAASVRGYTTFVVAAAVLTATLLGVKPILHGWVRKLEQRDLYAVFQMLLISVVLLPILPNRAYGPWNAFNPYEIWWMVVLIAGVSFSGYFAMKIAGPQRGVVLTGLFGGLVSSTAVTLSFSKIARESPNLSSVLSAGILVAAATMFPRTVLLAGILFPPLLLQLAAPLGVMMLVCFSSAVYFWKTSEREPGVAEGNFKNPFEIWTALKFGAFLAVVLLMVRALRDWFGDTGVYAIALLSGITDVDTVTLSMSRLANEDLSGLVAARAIIIAVIANTLFKFLLTAMIAGGSMARRVGVPLSLTAIVGIGMVVI